MLHPITLDEIAEVTGGGVVDGPDVTPTDSGEETVSSVSTDTRTLTAGALFVALRGETNDGHTYLKAAADAGATAFLTDRALKPEEPHLPHVVVPDTLHAMGDIARYLRDDFKGPVVGITGSLGKTTTKEMVAEILTTTYQTHKSAANHNNEIGVPKTIFEMSDTHTALVVEMGMRGLGEIRRLAEIAAPTIGVITNVGVTHIERLGTRENIAQAKGELFELLPTDGVAIYPATDDFASVLSEKFAGKKVTVAVNADADVKATDITRQDNGYRFTVSSPWGTQKFFLPSPGEFNIQNALLAIAVGGTLGIPLDSMARALNRWQAPAMRMEVLTPKSGPTVLSDAYNAAPDSMVGALKTLKDTPVGPNGKRIAILGEMKELGAYSNEGHLLVGRAAAKLAQPDTLILIGTDDARKIAAGALTEGFSIDHIHYFDTAANAAQVIAIIVQPGDAVLVKGSRSMAMEKIVAALVPEGGTVGSVAAPAAAPAAAVPPAASTPTATAPTESSEETPNIATTSLGERMQRLEVE